MHFKNFFYREYFGQGFNPAKPITDAIEKDNTKHLEAKNGALQKAMIVVPDCNQYLIHEIPNMDGLNPIEVTTIYPGLIIGSGYMHETLNKGEFKLGFHFDHTTGLPCIPGSSIKGVLRSFFPQFTNNALSEQDERKQSKAVFIAEKLGWNDPDFLKVHQLEMAVFDGVDLANSAENTDCMKYMNIYQRCCFYNAYISRAATGNKIFEIDTITPHGENPLKNPIPLNFLKIRPGVTFTIPMQLQDIDYLAIKKAKLKTLFETIIKLNGLGAKTNVGYGQFS